jgi:hypothetical protein
VWLALPVLAVARVASAASIATVDQQYFPSGTVGAVLSEIRGQSFTPTLAAIDAVEFMLVANSGAPNDIAIELYEGEGFSGALLGTTNTHLIASGSAQVYHFDFEGQIALVPGSIYSFRMVGGGTTSALRVIQDAFFLGYAEGNSLNLYGIPQTSDLWFSEGLHVPEPATALLLCAGLLFMPRRHVRSRIACGAGRRTVTRGPGQ